MGDPKIHTSGPPKYTHTPPGLRGTDGERGKMGSAKGMGMGRQQGVRCIWGQEEQGKGRQ